MIFRSLTLACLFVLLTAALTLAKVGQQDSEPQTLIKSARFLEEKPLDKKAKDVRQWAISWIIATDKVHVRICSDLITRIPKKYKYESELFGQYTIGMAAFQLAHPDRASEDDAAQLAGIESTLLSYEAIIKDQPKAHDDFMDDLIAKRAKGTLADYLKENTCRDKK
jgi:hypothetical protein